MHKRNKKIAKHLMLVRYFAFAAVFALIGVVALLLTKAATPTASVEPENGSVVSPASVVSDATASGGQAVKFAAASTGTRSCPAFPEFPDANCTGVPPGETLTNVSGDVIITQANTVYTNKNVSGTIYANANNITIRNVKAKGGINGSGRGVLIEDTELGPTTGTGGDDGVTVAGYTCRRCNIHNFSDGGKIYGDTLIEDSYIHDLWYKSGDHNDGLQAFTHDTGTVLLRHNVISSAAQSNSGQNGALMIADGWNGTLTAENNLFDSYGVYAVRLHENGKYYIRNNRWTRHATSTHTTVYGQILQWTGNAFQDNGQAINL